MFKGTQLLAPYVHPPICFRLITYQSDSAFFQFFNFRISIHDHAPAGFAIFLRRREYSPCFLFFGRQPVDVMMALNWGKCAWLLCHQEMGMTMAFDAAHDSRSHIRPFHAIVIPFCSNSATEHFETKALSPSIICLVSNEHGFAHVSGFERLRETH